ncbi:efflux RND transporter periplasmic adaptor subunit [Pseudoalteromonas phenolica]|uniref:efflux RND transporter periplasmic adaptor subunit n=1 Tax=Pseudoalteromonas phenolica TaxID=161398 RepID=UPI00110B6719|nr:efflux RND transporter periplasmic adaptor subunit [Pseudoalteromonas phenolica]TMO54468.1 efflux RND transporter periplasmic adaptor subunit [Pseudoalteromonas phenolica]
MKTTYSLLLVATFALLLIGCSEQQLESDKKAQLRPVRTLQLVEQSEGPLQEFPAVVDAASTADLSFKVSGSITDLYVKQGQPVQAGDLIAHIDDTDYKLAVDEAQANFDKAKADFARAEQLIVSGTISQSDYDKLKSQFTSAKTKLANAKNNLAYTTLKASFTGVVSRTHVEQFEEIQAKQAIATLQDIEHINLKVNVPESIMIRVSKDAPKQVFAEFAAIKEERFPLEFVEVSTQADEATKTYEVTFSMLPPEGYNILPGMTAKVMAGTPSRTAANLYLPLATVLKDNQGNYVWTVESQGANKGKITKTPVVIGEISSLGFPVISGVEQGTFIVTAGMSKVTDGQIVKFSGGK